MRKILWTLFAVIVISAVWISWNRPDWVVGGLPKRAAAQVPTPAELQPVIPALTDPQPTAPQSPDNGVVAPQPTNDGVVNEVVTPPAVDPTPPAPHHSALGDGFANYCYQMEDGSWTTVIYKGPGGNGMYPYAGPIDPETDAPLTAVGSQQWCADHASV